MKSKKLQWVMIQQFLNKAILRVHIVEKLAVLSPSLSDSSSSYLREQFTGSNAPLARRWERCMNRSFFLLGMRQNVSCEMLRLDGELNVKQTLGGFWARLTMFSLSL